MEKKDLIGSEIQAVPKPETEIGIDTKGEFADEVVMAASTQQLDLATLENFTNITLGRENIYRLIDQMSQDSTISSILEAACENVCQTNDEGKIVWAESADKDVTKYVNYLLDVLNVDKYVYSWVYSLIKYGDVYVKLFRQSDFEKDDVFDKVTDDKSRKLNEQLQHHFKDEDDYDTTWSSEDTQKMNESVNINLHKDNDHYALYTKLMRNPAEMFELTRFGKTCGYIKAPTQFQTYTVETAYDNLLKYKVQENNIDIYPATEFVHATFKDNNNRLEEEVSIFLENGTNADGSADTEGRTYQVNKGQSWLFNNFKTWRELGLLEASVLLNRLTKSSIIRLIEVQVGDMPKEQVQIYLTKLKSLIEQKTSLSEGKGGAEYTNPGPVENSVYVPVHGEQGKVNVSNVGGDVDVKSLSDLEYYRDKLFAGFGVPKQFFGFTDDAAGFNGGSSLTIISSQFGKLVKRIQGIICQLTSDLVNLFLVDRGLNKYINKFNIKMEIPVTQEEIDKRESLANRIRVVTDTMNTLGDISDSVIKLKIIKSLLSNVITDTDVIEYIQEQIDKIEEEEKENPEDEKKKKNEDETPEMSFPSSEGPSSSNNELTDFENEVFGEESFSSNWII